MAGRIRAHLQLLIQQQTTHMMTSSGPGFVAASRSSWRCPGVCALLFLVAVVCNAAPQAVLPAPTEADFTIHDFKFSSGERLPELRTHYATLGSPARNRDGDIVNAVLILHSTASSHQQFLADQFAGILFGPGQPLDVRHYFLIFPDAIGHGNSSKPSDGLHARFPAYDYDDMVVAQHALLEDGLGVKHLRVVLGTSMGCMHSWVWAEKYPSFMDVAVPLACLPAPLAGRNRMWRTVITEAIRRDPQWQGGEYQQQPRGALQLAAGIMLIAGSGALELQQLAPAGDAADTYLDRYVEHRTSTLDANDLLYALNASRNYDPRSQLGAITARVLHVNFADDFINPPELDIAEPAIKLVKQGRFVLVPISAATHGHVTHTWAAFWSKELNELLAATRTK
jgi:homoserine O-acetyltransferase/O-succinyltransferase